MTTANIFEVWRRAADLTLYRTLAGPTRVVRGDVTVTLHDHRVEYRTPWHPMAGVDFTDATLDLWAFDLTRDNDGSSCRCPCGDYLEAADVGELLESIREHCDRKHPGALKVKWPK